MIFRTLIDPASAVAASERLRLKTVSRFVRGRDMRDGVGAGDCESLEDKIVRIQSVVGLGCVITKAEARRMMRSPCEDSFSDVISKLIVRKVIAPEKNKFRRVS